MAGSPQNLTSISEDGGVAVELVPGQDSEEKCVYLTKNNAGTDNDMGGETGTLATPTDFYWQPGAGEVWRLQSVSFLIYDSGASMDSTEFGGIAGLTNGLQMQLRSKGSELEYVNIKNNLDIQMCFGSSVSGSRSGEESAGWLDEDDWFYGSIVFNGRVKLDGNESDFVKFRVRDSLSGVTHVRSVAHVWRPV